MTDALGGLAAHARETRVVVVGGGIAGLVSALECAKVGMTVTLVEASGRLGGVVRGAEVAGLRLDVGAESYATRGGHVRALIDELGLGDGVTAPQGGRAWVAGLPGGGAAPLPAGGVLGIPDNPFAADVRRVIGWGGAWRAYLDRLRPPLTIGHQHSLGALVRARMGAAVLDRLVAPVTTGVYSARPDDIDVDIAVPGLNAALTRAGSLSGAVAQLRGGRTTAPGAAVEGLDGGMTRLVDALTARLDELGVDVRTDAPVQRLEKRGAEWVVGVDPSTSSETGVDPSASSGTGESSGTAAHDSEFVADAVIVATSEPVARRLLAPVVPGLDAASAPAPVVEIVTLVLDAPALDANPRGTGVLTVPGSHAAKALTHATAKWGWVARAAGRGTHVVRVSFGAQGEAPATAGRDDADAAALALSEASALLGVPLSSSQVKGSHREVYAQSQPAATIGRRAVVDTARAAVAKIPGLAASGAWLAGTGLAQVVPDAIAEAERIRRAVLFGAASHQE